MQSQTDQKYLASTWKLVQSVFPHTTADDFCRAIDVAYHVQVKIKGRHCGNIGDKISQYLAVIEYAHRSNHGRIDCLEIGTLFGGSCLMKLYALKDVALAGKVVCIDPMSGFYGKEVDEISGVQVNSSVFFHNIQSFGFSQDSVELRTCMSNSEEAVRGLNKNSFPIIMIDGDHSYEGVKSDWLAYSPLLKSDGFLMIDDYGEPAWPYITVFLNEVLAEPKQKFRTQGVVGTTFIFGTATSEVNIQDQPQTASIPLTIEFLLKRMTLSRATEEQINEDLKSFVEGNLDSRLVKVYLTLAREALRNSHFDECDSWLQKALFTGAADPNLKFETLHLLGLSQIRQNLSAKAASTLQMAYRVPGIGVKNILKASLELGNALLQNNDYVKAEEVYLHSLNRAGLENPQAYDLLVRLANLYLTMKRLDDAEACFVRSLSVQGIAKNRKFHPKVGLARVYMHNERHQDAERLLLAALATEGVTIENQAKTLLDLVNCYISQKNSSGISNILHAFNRLEDLPFSFQYEIHMMIGWYWQNSGDLAKAHGMFTKASCLKGISTEQKRAALESAEKYSLGEEKISSSVSYATVREYNKFLEEWPDITYMSGDLKNFQRPWVVDTLTSKIPKGGRLLEIGADKCELADLMQKRGYEVWVVDIFDEFGGGVARYEETKKRFPNLKVLRGYFHEIQGVPRNYFDAIYSCSVVEHTPIAAIPLTFNQIFDCLTEGGLSIHAIDFTVEGKVLENYVLMNEVLKCNQSKVSAAEIGSLALLDVDTFYLSPAGHYQWRKFMKKDYDEYPFRRVTSLNVVSEKKS